GRRAWLVRAAAEQLSAGALDALADDARLLERLDRTRAAHDDDAVAADVDATNADDRVVRLGLTADQLVGMGDSDDFADAGKGLDDRWIGNTLRSGDTDGSAVGARDGMRLQPHLL